MSKKILIIDNGTKNLSQLLSLIQPCTPHVLSYPNINHSAFQSCDTIILTGGNPFPINGNESQLFNEIRLIRLATVPILGICFGGELIASVFGAKLRRHNLKIVGKSKLDIKVDNILFSNLATNWVFESHHWTIHDPGNEVSVLATTNSQIAAFKHKKRLAYGVQFHPELFPQETCGGQIIKNFLTLSNS